MSREIKREVRYIVIKLRDIDQNTQRQLRNFMEDIEIPSRDCVVVESDWPEYEPVWKMIEDRVRGNGATEALASREGEGAHRMSESKQRGTYEQRKAEAIARHEPPKKTQSQAAQYLQTVEPGIIIHEKA